MPNLQGNMMVVELQWNQASICRWSSKTSRSPDFDSVSTASSPQNLSLLPLHLAQHLYNLRQHLFRILTDPQCFTPGIPFGRIAKETLLAPRPTHVQYANRHLPLLRPLHQSPRRIRRQTTSDYQDAARRVHSLFSGHFGRRGNRFAKHDDRGLKHAAFALRIPRAVFIRVNTYSSTCRFLRRRRQTRRTRGVSERRVRRIRHINVAVGIRLEAFFSALVRVLRIQRARGEHFVEEGRPGGVQAGELGLEGAARVFVAAGQADEGAEVAVEFDGGEGRVRGWMEGVDVWSCGISFTRAFDCQERRDVRTLCNHASYHAHLAQVSTRAMCIVRPRPFEVRPAQETPGPVSFARLMVLAEFIEVDWLIRLVQCIRPILSSIVCQARCYRYARARKQQCLSILADTLRRRRKLARDTRLRYDRSGQTGCQKLQKRSNGTTR